MPIIIAAMVISLIGIPLAVLITPLFLATMFFTNIFAALFLGEAVFAYLKKKGSLDLKFITGFATFSALTFIPIFGFLVIFIATLIGTGAFLIEKRRLFLLLKNKNRI